MSYSTLIIVGNLGKNPEMRYTPQGTAVATLNVAVNQDYKDRNGNKQKQATWFYVHAWGKTAEACNQYLSKGSQVLVEGELTPDKETGGPKVFTRNDGSSGASYEVNARTVRFLSTKVGEQLQLDDEDVPF